MSPFEVLGISSNSSVAEIKSAYRILAKRYHPDSNSGEANINKFREVNDAYRAALNYNGTENDLIGIDIFDEFIISVKESISGINRSYQFHKIVNCECGALGVKCLKCRGVGYIKKGITMKTKCPRCNGYGFENINDCIKCHGSGKKSIIESIKLNVNKIINNGDVYKYTYSQGKLIIKFIIKRSDRDLYDRNGNDLIYDAKISPLDQILGTVLLIPRIGQDSLKFQVKENVMIPSYYKIPNSGIPGTNGSMIVRLFTDPKLMDLSLIPKIRSAVRGV